MWCKESDSAAPSLTTSPAHIPGSRVSVRFQTDISPNSSTFPLLPSLDRSSPLRHRVFGLGHPRGWRRPATEIKQGFKLRPTKTVDKSKPIIVAEIDDEDSIAPTKRSPAPPAPSLVVDTAPPEHSDQNPRASPSPRSSPRPGPSTASSFPFGTGGVRLRKTVTIDKSGLIVDESLKQKSVQLVEPAPSTAFIPPKKDPPRRDFQRPEIPTGTAAARIAKFMQSTGGSDATNGGTVPRNFRPSPVRFPITKE
ncbi:hypothetical protein OSTOST_20010, partial [Ostertagia ostertagi]